MRALLLDFDGVILATAALKAQAFAELYADCDPSVFAPVVDYFERHGGVTRRDKIAHVERHFFGRAGDAAAVDRLTARFRARVFDAVLAAPFVPGAQHLLAAARGAIALHVISGTPHDELVEIVERRDLAQWFVSVHGAPPPKREAFARILGAYGYRPGEVLAIGDAITEYEAARELGIAFLAVVPEGTVNRFPSDVRRIPSLEPVPALLGLA